MGKTRRHKKRTHVALEGEEEKKTPTTFVMERGKVGKILNRLVLDLRRVMEPHTASKLKVRHRNVLKDFVQVAGPLGVTHFIVISRTEQHINLRLCRLPRGPTITFHVNSFSLAREVVSSLRKTATSLSQFLSPPLLVLNNFSTADKPSKLLTTMLQNMFASINIQTVKLANIQRCVLFNCTADSHTINFRHYNIRAVPRGVSRSVKRLGRTAVPNLSQYKDISDYMLGGYVSESEGEEVAVQEVTLPQDMPGRGNVKSGQSTVRLTELGPRLTLRLLKIESGVCGGEVLHHEFIHKSKQEAKEVRRRVREKKIVREERRQQQEANVSRKKREKEKHKQRCMEGHKPKTTLDEDSSSEDDDTEWYRQEVGAEPDPDTFTPATSLGRKRRRGHGSTPEGKRRRVTERGRSGRERATQSTGEEVRQRRRGKETARGPGRGRVQSGVGRGGRGIGGGRGRGRRLQGGRGRGRGYLNRKGGAAGPGRGRTVLTGRVFRTKAKTT